MQLRNNHTNRPSQSPTYILVGGGLQNALLLLALAHHKPNAKVVVLERGEQIGGNHTWSFHSSDFDGFRHAFVRGLFEHSWPSHEVHFPGLHRELRTAYFTFTSEHLHGVVRHLCETNPQLALRLNTDVETVSAGEVVLSCGERIYGDVVIDARGPSGLELSGRRAYQKFVGLELELSKTSPRSTPLLMDARVPQTDDFRFFYVLPFTPRRVLIEDTYFSDTPGLDQKLLREEVLRYAATNGYTVKHVLREESGVLPLPTGIAHIPPPTPPYQAGYAGGWYHPVTGYSFPIALRFAECVASVPLENLQETLDALHKQHLRQARTLAMMNRVWFTSFAPEKRWQLLARFYRMPEASIGRFYAMQLKPVDLAWIIKNRVPWGISLRLALQGGNPS